MINTCTNSNWNTTATYENHESHIDSLDEILRNLKSDPEHYNHGMSQEEWMQQEQRD